MADGGGRIARRAIAPLEIDGLTPAALADEGPTFQWVSPDALLVDETYQRSLSKRSLALIRRIIEGWDWARFKPPVVARTPEGLEVIDGQHTAIAAASHPAIAGIPVMIVQAAEIADRAGAFLGHNRDRLNITSNQMHIAAVAAGDPEALTVEAVCARAGVKLLRYPPSNGGGYSPGDCVAFSTLYRTIGRRGAMRSRIILECLSQSDQAPVAAWQIQAVEILFHDPQYKGQAEAPAVTAALREIGDDLERQARVFAASHRLTLTQATAAILFRRANRGRRKVA